MLTKSTVILAALLASGTCAAAQELCGDLPIAPAILSPAEMHQRPPAGALSAMHSAFAEMKRWQGDLKSWRDCLNATVNTDKRDISEAQHSDKPDKDKIAKLETALTTVNHLWDLSVDDEERVVNEFHAAQTAYCARKDVNVSICPKN